MPQSFTTITMHASYGQPRWSHEDYGIFKCENVQYGKNTPLVTSGANISHAKSTSLICSQKRTKTVSIL